MGTENRPASDDQAERVLRAFRDVTRWSDELVLHYARCESYCTPICGHEEMDCPEGHELRARADGLG
jgi:hypothetical protein